MNVADITTELGDHGFTNTVTPTRQLAFINDTIWDICSRERWPFLEKTALLNFDGTNAFPSNWPTDFKAVLSIVDTAFGAVMRPERVDYLDKLNPANLNDSGNPIYYYLMGSGGTSASDAEGGPGAPTVAFFYPKVGSAATARMQMRYIAQHPQVAAGTAENGIWIPPQHHRVIVLGALWKCFDMEDDPEMAMRYQQLYETRIDSMKRDIFMRQYDLPDRVYVLGGGDDFDFDYF